MCVCACVRACVRACVCVCRTIILQGSLTCYVRVSQRHGRTLGMSHGLTKDNL